MAFSFMHQMLRKKVVSTCALYVNKLQIASSIFQSTRDYVVSNCYKHKLNGFKFEPICSAPLLPYINSIRGFKDKDVLTKRCKDCYFQKLDDRWYVFCNTHPRHKQRQKIQVKEKWIITHSTHGVKKF